MIGGAQRTAARVTVLAAASAALLFTAGAVAAPFLETTGGALPALLRTVYGPLCHQLSDRCLSFGGVETAACARCLGLYAGGALGLLGFGLLSRSLRVPRRRWLVAALAPTAVDALLPWIGLPGLPNLPRLLLALPAGAALGAFLAAGLADWVRMRRRRRAVPPGTGAPDVVWRTR